MGAVDDVFDEIESLALAGGSTAWALKRRKFDDGNDQIVVVSEDGGGAFEISEPAGIGDSALEEPGVMVSVRAAAWDGDASKAKGQEILDAFHGARAATIGSRDYMIVRALTPEPVFVGFDDRGRPTHNVALRLLAEQVVS